MLEDIYKKRRLLSNTKLPVSLTAIELTAVSQSVQHNKICIYNKHVLLTGLQSTAPSKWYTRHPSRLKRTQKSNSFSQITDFFRKPATGIFVNRRRRYKRLNNTGEVPVVLDVLFL